MDGLLDRHVGSSSDPGAKKSGNRTAVRGGMRAGETDGIPNGGGEKGPVEGAVREGKGGRVVEDGLGWVWGGVMLPLVLVEALAILGRDGDAAAPADSSPLSSSSSSSPSPAQRHEKAEIPR